MSLERRPFTLSYKPCSKLVAIPTHHSTTPSTDGIQDLAFSPDGLYLAASFRREVHVWELKEDRDGMTEAWARKVRFSLESRDKASISCMAWSSSNYLVVGTSAGRLELVKINEKVPSVQWSLRYSIQPISQEAKVRGFQVSDEPIKLVAIDSGFTTMAVVAGKSEVGIWKRSDTVDSKKAWVGLFYLTSPESYVSLQEEVVVTSVAWDENPSDGELLVVSYLNHGIVTWNASVPSLSNMVNVETVLSPSGSLSPDGRKFAIPNSKGTFDIYDLALKNKVVTLTDPDDEVSVHASWNDTSPSRQASFIRDGSWIVGTGKGKLNIWNVFNNIRAQRLNLDWRSKC
ncbi:hypothetical protein CC1G_11253 [Coprinopsis cinerea okayama7|uniref:Uncharacterized protein n=1 Tax=Coprinopsis cinerea (strain Okayama-7 / 130 / ATCC MYA-4618 / FGSC 9003) TaxID=240176 RepID=A8NLQ8_COPC7|nr:hypothetical protein CC1G_11253 [Coprinopsis cinerea okayama7\|eukprot:XP_001834754.2 hypothetical protein CC1G_11253 [Coprinopsis cinerea okayama7\